ACAPLAPELGSTAGAWPGALGTTSVFGSEVTTLLGLGAQLGLTEPVMPVAGVASKGTQPNPGKYTSVHACRLKLVSVTVLPCSVPPWVKPNATRDGILAWRSIQPSAAEYCRQKPFFLSRKSTILDPLVLASVDSE